MAKRKEDNLIMFTSDQNREEASRNGRKGGIASGEARRRKKSMQELASIVNSIPLSKTEQKTLPKEIDSNDMTKQMMFLLTVYKNALKGNTKAMKLWIDLSDYSKEEHIRLENEKLKAEITQLNNMANNDNGMLEDVMQIFKNIETEHNDTE